MKLENLEFISIGGYCASLYVLGKDRIRGPIDNVLLLSYKALELLFNNKYLSYLIEHQPDSIVPRKDMPEKLAYEYSNIIQIIHNTPDSKYLKNLADRIENFNLFWANFKQDKNKLFIFTIPHSFMNSDRTKLLSNKLTEVIIYLDKLNILDRVIFVGTKKKQTEKARVWWNNYIPQTDLTKYQKKYPHFKYIELTEVSMANDAEKLKVYPQFVKKIQNLLLTKKSKKSIRKDSPNYYLYF